MSRLFWLLLALVGCALTFTAKSPGLLGIGLLLGIVGFLGFVLALAASRVSASARPETAMASVEDLGALRKQAMPDTGKTPPSRVRSSDSERTTR